MGQDEFTEGVVLEMVSNLDIDFQSGVIYQSETVDGASLHGDD